MTREEFYTAIESFLSENKIGEKLIPRELVAELSERLAKLSLPPAEGAEAIVKKYEDEYDFKFHWVQRDRVIRMMREFAAQQQPTAEGAEEIEAELRGYARDIVRLHKPIMEVNPQLAMDSIGNDLVKMFNRLAQRIAEKMVSERLREELIRYIKWYGGFNYENMTDEMLVNEYLKTRDSHESV
jgi:hypothetical protein